MAGSSHSCLADFGKLLDETSLEDKMLAGSGSRGLFPNLMFLIVFFDNYNPNWYVIRTYPIILGLLSTLNP